MCVRGKRKRERGREGIEMREGGGGGEREGGRGGASLGVKTDILDKQQTQSIFS